MKQFMLKRRQRHLERRLVSLTVRLEYRLDIIASYDEAHAKQRELLAVGIEHLNPRQLQNLDRHEQALKDEQTARDRAVHEYFVDELRKALDLARDDLHEVTRQLDALNK